MTSKTRKKMKREDIRIFQKRLFYSLVKFNCSAYGLRKGDFEISQQRDLPKYISWSIIDIVQSEETQRSVADAVGVARSVSAWLSIQRRMKWETLTRARF